MDSLVELFSLSPEELEKRGWVQCSHCNGYGSSLKEDGDRCSRCGGSGLVKLPQ